MNKNHFMIINKRKHTISSLFYSYLLLYVLYPDANHGLHGAGIQTFFLPPKWQMPIYPALWFASGIEKYIYIYNINHYKPCCCISYSCFSIIFLWPVRFWMVLHQLNGALELLLASGLFVG